MKSKFTRLILALGMLCGVAGAQETRMISHGPGDPRSQSPVPSCAFTKAYIDDTTGTVYTASGYPCVWAPPPNSTAAPGTATQAQTTDGSGHFVATPLTIDSSGNANTPGTVQAPLRDKGGQVFNVRAYGAVGDGVTDDTAAFVAVFTAAAASGSEAYCPAGIYSVSTIAVTSAMSQVHFNGPSRVQNSVKSCVLKARGAGVILANAGDNTGTSHPSLNYFRVSNITFDGNAVSLGGIYWDFGNFPEIDHDYFTNFAACATSSGVPVEPCAREIKLGASQYCQIHDNTFVGSAYAIDGQWAYTSRPLAGGYGCNAANIQNNIISANLGMRNSGDTTVNKNDVELSLQLPAVAQIDFTDTTGGAALFNGTVTENYSESTTLFPDAANLTYATNVLIHCGASCVGITVKNNKRLNGNGYLAGSKGVWIDSNVYHIDISGNPSFTFWETPIYMTAGKSFLTGAGIAHIDANNYGVVPTPTAVQPTLALTLSSGALTAITPSGGTSGAFVAAPFVTFTGGNCTVIPTAVGVQVAGTVTGYTITRAGSGCDGTLAATSVGGLRIVNIFGALFTSPTANSFASLHLQPGREWMDDTGFHFDNRAVSYAVYALGASDTSIDLQLANLYEDASATVAISAVTNSRPGQKFSIRNRAGTLTLTNSVFNLCSGADSAIPAGATWTFDVGTGGTVRQANCATSGALTGGNCIQANASGQLTDAGVACGGTPQFPKQIATVAPTLTSSTSTIGLNTIYTPPAAGVFRMCLPMTVTVAGTAGTYQPFANYTSDGRANTPNITASMSLTTQWTTNAGAACYVFYADSGVAIKWEIVASGVTGTPTVRYSVTLEQLQ